MRTRNIILLSVVTLLITVSYAGIATTPVAAQPTPTIYYVPQAGSTWVNQGSAGASYNAYVSTPGLFRTQSNGYTYWGDIGRNDFVSIPAGGATNNLNAASWEIGFHFNGVGGQRFQKLWDKAYGGFMIELDGGYGDSATVLTLYRATTGGSGARWYIPTDTMIRAGHNYYVQIAWDSSAGPGKESYPAIWIGEDGNAPVRQTHWDETGSDGSANGALAGTGAWYDDSAANAVLGNTGSGMGGVASAKTCWLNGGLYVYRQYNAIVDFSSGGSWNTDKLAWTTTTPAVKPTVTPTVKPTVTPTVTPKVKPTVTPTVTPTPTLKAVAKTPTATPTVKATATPTVKAEVKATATPTVKAEVKATVKAEVKPTATPTVKATATPKPNTVELASVTTNATNTTVPDIAVPTGQTSSVASLPPQPVLEFSVLGLGLPAIVAGLIYLFIRR